MEERLVYVYEAQRPVSRRFVQYLSMQSAQICVLVRDVSTGRILVEPPTEHLWLVRRPVQYGRNTSPNPFHVMASVDEKMFETFDAAQKDNWRFGFNEYYGEC